MLCWRKFLSPGVVSLSAHYTVVAYRSLMVQARVRGRVTGNSGSSTHGIGQAGQRAFPLDDAAVEGARRGYRGRSP